MNSPYQYNFDPIYSGTTQDGATINININGIPFDFTGSDVLMHVRPNAMSDKISESLSLADGDFTISGIDLILEPRLVTLKYGEYRYDILIKKATGEYEIYIYGKITVMQPVTRPSTLI